MEQGQKLKGVEDWLPFLSSSFDEERPSTGETTSTKTTKTHPGLGKSVPPSILKETIHTKKQKFLCNGTLSSGKRWGCNRAFAISDVLRSHLSDASHGLCIQPLLEEEIEAREKVHEAQGRGKSRNASVERLSILDMLIESVLADKQAEAREKSPKAEGRGEWENEVLGSPAMPDLFIDTLFRPENKFPKYGIFGG